jgi:glyoxylase-like metal-dependent hydrolase (beta-lactamase superfamily II)
MVTYDGDVAPGGAPQTRDLEGLTLTKVAVDPEMSNNCYLLECQETGECVLIDAAAEPERLLDLIGDRELAAIVTTHQHWDHHRALAEVKAAHPTAEVIAGGPDADAITEQTDVRVDRRVSHGDRVAVGTCELSVLAIAGHTPGSIALHWSGGDGHLFTGDSLFPGGVGNTFGDAEAFRTLVEEVSTKVFDSYGDGVWFYPGHGGDSTLGAERPHLDEWRDRGW